MKKLLFIVVAFVTVLSFSSCSILTQTRIREYSAKQHNVQSYSEDMQVRVDYDNIIKFESQEMKLKRVGGISGAIQAAKFDCLYANDFDVLVDPIYKVVKSSGKKVIVSVQCHPGYYEAYVAPEVPEQVAEPQCTKPESAPKAELFKAPRPKCDREKPCHFKAPRPKCSRECGTAQNEVCRNRVVMKNVTINCDNPVVTSSKEGAHKGASAKEQGHRECHTQCDGHQQEGDCKANNEGKCEGKCEGKSEAKPEAKGGKKGGK